MSEKKYEDRTTEEIRAISEDFFAQSKAAQNNKYKIPFIIVAASLVVLLVMITVNYIKNPTGTHTALTDKDKLEDRLQNLDELNSNLIRYTEENPEGELSDFLEEVALLTDIDNYNSDSDTISTIYLPVFRSSQVNSIKP